MLLCFKKKKSYFVEVTPFTETVDGKETMTVFKVLLPQVQANWKVKSEKWQLHILPCSAAELLHELWNLNSITKHSLPSVNYISICHNSFLQAKTLHS